MRLIAFAMAALIGAQAAYAVPRDAAVCANAAGNPRHRIAACTRLIEEKAETQTLIERAKAYQQAAGEANNKNYADDQRRALADFDRAVALEPKNPAVYLARSRFHESDFELTKALADLDRAIALAPTTAALEARGDVRAYIGDDKGASEDFTKVLSLEPAPEGVFVKRAQARWNLSDDSGARDDFDRAVGVAPESPDVYVSRGIFLAAQFRVQQALRDFDTALGIRPDFPAAFDARANVYLSRDEFEPAVADLTRVLQAHPQYIDARSRRAGAYFALRQNSRAIADGTKVVMARGEPEDYAARGMAFLQKGGTAIELARADFSVALKVFRDRQHAARLRQLCQVFCALRNPVGIVGRYLIEQLKKTARQAQIERGQAAERLRNIADAQARLGLVALKLGDDALAHSLFAKALRYSEDGAIARYGLGVLKHKAGDLAGAKDDFAAGRLEHSEVDRQFALIGIEPVPVVKVTYADPVPEAGVERDVVLCGGRDFAVSATGAVDFTKTIEACTRVIRADVAGPVKSRAYTLRAQWTDMTGAHDSARADRNAALVVDPNNVDALLARASFLAGQHQTAKALADFDRVIALEPKSFLGWFGRCEARADAGDMKGAVADCDRAVVVAGDPDWVVQRRAPVLLRAGEYARALKDYEAYFRETARRTLPADPYALFGRGLARLRLGDRAGAQADLKSARALHQGVDREFAALGLKP